MDISEKLMARCLELAACGKGNTAPNPMVGAVIVRDGRIIGEGDHCRYGDAHAEDHAITSVKDKSLLLDATMYVSLEPCSHYGKRFPCAEQIIRSGLPRVVVACMDANPKVFGNGIRMLQEAGVDVAIGVMEREAIALNRFFMTAHIKKRPYIILKWAQSEDGFVDRLRNDATTPPVILSTPLTRLMVHKLRSEVQAIMVGTRTITLDDPSLTVRYWAGNAPLRITIDQHARIPESARILTDGRPTLVYSADNASLKNIMADLYERKINSLLVEGGPILHHSFFEDNLWDEIIVETAPVKLENGVSAFNFRQTDGVQLSKRMVIPAFLSSHAKTSFIEVYSNRISSLN